MIGLTPDITQVAVVRHGVLRLRFADGLSGEVEVLGRMRGPVFEQARTPPRSLGRALPTLHPTPCTNASARARGQTRTSPPSNPTAKVSAPRHPCHGPEPRTARRRIRDMVRRAWFGLLFAALFLAPVAHAKLVPTFSQRTVKPGEAVRPHRSGSPTEPEHRRMNGSPRSGSWAAPASSTCRAPSGSSSRSWSPASTRPQFGSRAQRRAAGPTPSLAYMRGSRSVRRDDRPCPCRLA
jgi:hypothetical protein